MLNWLRSLPFLVVAGLVSAILGACTTNPATSQSEISFVSPAQEREIGAEAHPQIVEQFGIYEELPDLNLYVATIASRLHSVSELSTQPFTFSLLDSDMVNAFAIPGGYVYVTRGLMALANSEAELAGVIGHEIGHVTARHGAQRQTQQMAAGAAGMAAGIILEDRTLMNLAGIGAMAWIAGYSRGQELESDELGVRYLTRAGYDPLAMASFLQQLERQSQLARQFALEDNEQDPADSWFATHPRTQGRVIAAAELASASLVDPFVGRNTYLRQIDGMVFGDSPAQGFIREHEFSHPELRLTFEVPDGFRMINAPTRVTARNREGAAIIFDGGSYSGGSMVNYVQEWSNVATGGWVALNDLEHITINGMEAATGWLRLPTQQGDVEVRLVAIRYDSDTVYRFFFSAPVAQASNLALPFRRTTYSFRQLSASEASALKPLRIDVVEVRAGDTIETFANQMQFENLQRERFMVLNGLTSEADLRAGMLVKIVRE